MNKKIEQNRKIYVLAKSPIPTKPFKCKMRAQFNIRYNIIMFVEFNDKRTEKTKIKIKCKFPTTQTINKPGNVHTSYILIDECLYCNKCPMRLRSTTYYRVGTYVIDIIKCDKIFFSYSD